MDSDKAVKIGRVILKCLAKKGARDLMAYGLPMIGATLIPLEMIEGFQEIIGLISENNDIA